MSLVKKYWVFVLLLFFSITIVYSEPQIVLSALDQVMGTYERGTEISGTFHVANDGDGPLELNIISTCDCLTVAPASRSLNTGEEFDIHFTIDTSELSGEVERDIVIETNITDNPVIYLTVSAVVTVDEGAVDSVSDDEGVGVDDDGSIVIELYSFKNCSTCKKIKEKLVKDIEKKHDISVRVDFIDLSDVENYKKLMVIKERYDATKLPVVIVGDTALSGKKEIFDNLETVITEEGEGISSIDDEKFDFSNYKLMEYVSLFIIISAGLMDGINPCAFAVIILLVSFLLVRSSSKKEVLIAGSIYTFAVFLSYLLIGFGLLNFLKLIVGFEIVQKVVKWGISALLVVLSVLSFYDYFKARSGKEDEMLLQLPGFLKNKIRKEFRGKIKVGSIIVTPFVLGVIVSSLELACTGQIYVPIIINMIKTGQEVAVSVFYLILYNLMFVLPLIAVFVLVFMGISSKKIAEYFTQSIGKIKIAIGVLFIVFAVFTFVIY